MPPLLGDRDRVAPACAKALGALGEHDVLAIQVARVLRHVSPEQIDAVEGPGDVTRALRTRQVLPERLIVVCRSAASSLVDVPPEALALAFAASAYPERASLMASRERNTGELERRVGAFTEVWRELHGSAVSVDSVREVLSRLGRIPVSASDERLATLCGDLTAADPSLGEAEAEARRAAGGLYLCTLYREMGVRCWEGWLAEGPIVSCFRRFFPAPPPPDRVPGTSDVCWAYMVSLRDHGLRQLRSWGVTDPEDALSNCWLAIWERLVSGFPYFGFRSKLSTWWAQCLRHSIPDPEPIVERDVDVPGVAADPDALMIAPHVLRLLREGYRLVRITFTSRSQGTESRGSAGHAAARANERLRRAVDAIWRRRIELELKGDPIPPGEAKRILSEFPGLSRSAIDNLSKRLRRRLRAYALARVQRVPNREILAADLVGGRQHRERGRGFAREPAVLTVASLARCAAVDETLLWAFLAHACLHGRVQPQRPDRRSFPWIVAELWYWDPAAQAARWRSNAPARPERLMATSVEAEPLRALGARLAEVTDERELDAFAHTSDWAEERSAAARLLAQAVSPVALAMWEPRELRQWRRGIADHWLVPLWYLAIVEDLAGRELRDRLGADGQEWAALAPAAAMLRGRAGRLV